MKVQVIIRYNAQFSKIVAEVSNLLRKQGTCTIIEFAQKRLLPNAKNTELKNT